MYIPKHYKEPNVEAMHDLIRTYPLANLITVSSNGLNANHIPFYLAQNDASVVLCGHVARANPVWQDLDAQAAVLVIFQGVNAYISPSWYATKELTGRVVPTWNYNAVHVYGTIRVIPDAVWIRQQIDDLTTQQEAGFEHPWSVDDAPKEFTDKLIEKALMGIEVTVTRLDGKWKVDQNEPSKNQASVIQALQATGDAQLNEMAQLIRAKGKHI